MWERPWFCRIPQDWPQEWLDHRIRWGTQGCAWISYLPSLISFSGWNWISNHLLSFFWLHLLAPWAQCVPDGVLGFPSESADFLIPGCVKRLLILLEPDFNLILCFISYINYLLSPRDPISVRALTCILSSLFLELFSYFRALDSFLRLWNRLPKSSLPSHMVLFYRSHFNRLLHIHTLINCPNHCEFRRANGQARRQKF